MVVVTCQCCCRIRIVAILLLKTERVIPPGRIRGSRVRLFIGIHIRISMWSRIRMCIRRRRRVRDVIRTRRLY